MLALVVTQAFAEIPRDMASGLVSLVKPDEREAQIARFMIQVSPFPAGPTSQACAERTMLERVRPYFIELYQASLGQPEAVAATAFFSSAEGKDAVRIRNSHEAQILAAAVAGTPVVSETPDYPAPVKVAVERFAQTEAGKKFYGEDIESSPAAKSGLDAIRNAVMLQCLSSTPASAN